MTGCLCNKRDRLNKRNNTLTQGTQAFTMIKTGTVGLFLALAVVSFFFIFFFHSLSCSFFSYNRLSNSKFLYSTPGTTTTKTSDYYEQQKLQFWHTTDEMLIRSQKWQKSTVSVSFSFFNSDFFLLTINHTRKNKCLLTQPKQTWNHNMLIKYADSLRICKK